MMLPLRLPLCRLRLIGLALVLTGAGALRFFNLPAPIAVSAWSESSTGGTRRFNLPLASVLFPLPLLPHLRFPRAPLRVLPRRRLARTRLLLDALVPQLLLPPHPGMFLLAPPLQH
jgi:hypothetical protein